MTETTADLYVHSFEAFLAHTDEKAVFVDEFAGYIERYDVRSLPDRYEQFMAKSAEVTTLLETHYRTEGGFSFPFLHIFLSTHKQN